MYRKSCCTTPGIGGGFSIGISKMLKFHVKVFMMGKVLSGKLFCMRTGPEFIKLFSCSFELSMKFFLFINVKMPINVGILTFMSMKSSILGLSEPKKCQIS